MLAGLGEGVEDLVDFDSTTFVHSLLPDSDPV
jgi:signal recognition particle GTPase